MAESAQILIRTYIDKGDDLKMKQNTSNKIIFMLAAIAALTAGIWMGANTPNSNASHKAAEIQGVILPRAKPIQDFALIDQNKQAFTLNNLKNKWSLIFIGYTHCPDVCPTALSTLKQVSQLMQAQKLQTPQIIFISVDPERDTPDILAEYVNYFNKDFIGLTGTLEELKKLTTQLSVSFAKAPGASGDISQDDYLMDHSSSFMLINPQGKLQSFITAPHTTANVIYAIQNSQIYFQQTQK